VVKIIDQYHKGDLDANVKEFTPCTNLEKKSKDLESDEVVEIIKQDCRSMVKDEKEAMKKIITRTMEDEVSYKENSLQ
jgi:hypothetical protein